MVLTSAFNSYSRDDFFIEAFAGTLGQQRIRFSLGQVAYRAETESGKTSIIGLAGGKEIRVGLTLDALDDILYGHTLKQGPMIDLKPFTSPEAMAVDDEYTLYRLFQLSLKDLDGLHVALWGFTSAEGKEEEGFGMAGTPLLVNIKKVDRFEPDKTFGNPARIGFIANNQYPITHGKRRREAFFRMSIEEFKSRIAQAKVEGCVFLNLLEETRPWTPPDAPKVKSPLI